MLGSNLETFSNVGQCVSFAAHGGTFLSGIILPAGQTLTFQNGLFSACNALVYGYQLNLGTNVPVASKNVGCADVPFAGTTIGPFPTAVLVRPYLQDLTCGATYYVDGNHGQVTTASPTSYVVDITDSGPGCSAPGPRPVPTGGTGNLHDVLTIS
jgi:hypothetical protein